MFVKYSRLHNHSLSVSLFFTWNGIPWKKQPVQPTSSHAHSSVYRRHTSCVLLISSHTIFKIHVFESWDLIKLTICFTSPRRNFFSERNGVLFIQLIVVIEYLLSTRKMPRPIELKARPGLWPIGASTLTMADRQNKRGNYRENSTDIYIYTLLCIKELVGSC